jgi:nucleoid DNA-binding protein
MTKSELRSALAEATQTNKKTAGVFLDTLSALTYKEIKKTGEFVLPGFGKLVKQKRKRARVLIQRRNRRSRFQPRPLSNFGLPRPQRTGFWG